MYQLQFYSFIYRICRFPIDLYLAIKGISVNRGINNALKSSVVDTSVFKVFKSIFRHGKYFSFVVALSIHPIRLDTNRRSRFWFVCFATISFIISAINISLNDTGIT